MKLLKNRSHDNLDESLWASISDLMSGLMIIFLFIAISFMIKINEEKDLIFYEKETIENEQEAIKQILNTYSTIRVQIYEDLYDEFKDDLKNWNVVIDPKDLSVRFQEPEVFFQKGKASLNKEFRNILENFFPRYINVIHSKYKLNIEEIRIEGYTSSEWTGSNNELDSYFNNMKLSQERTRNVLQYVMNLEKTNYCQDWLIEHLTANGMSYSHRYFNENGEEDMEKSRRVEFKIRTNADKIISEIIEQYKEKNGD